MALADYQIIDFAQRFGMITPFEPAQVSLGVVSSGVSSHGYDARVGRDVRLLSPPPGVVIDPKRSDPDHFKPLEIFSDFGGEFVVIPPQGFCLASTVETFDIPRNIIVLCVGKSTYARNALFVNITPLESEWRGQVTLEFFNAAPNPARLYVGEGGCQFVFLDGFSPRTSYADRKGKYMDQAGVTLARIKETA